MMQSYVKYDKTTREILGTTTVEDVGNLPAEFGFVAGVGSALSHYITTGLRLTQREANPASLDTASIQADGVSEAVVSEIPAPTRLTILVAGQREKTLLVSDGTLIVTSTVPTLFLLRLAPSGRFLPVQFRIEAT